jgi:hypothetical protein
MATEVNPQTVHGPSDLGATAVVPRSRFFTISLHLPTFAWDGLEAFEIGSDHVRHFDCKRDDLGEARGRTGEPSTWPAITKVTEDRLSFGSLVGTPDEVAAYIRSSTNLRAATLTSSIVSISRVWTTQSSSARRSCSPLRWCRESVDL